MAMQELRQQVEMACRHLLSEQNRDRYAPAYGCFDRRFWGWKLVDYPEATFQRNVYPLAWLFQRTEEPGMRAMLREAVVAGLTFAAAVQHKDGSFDQAFPHEHSFGATAFLLQPLLAAYQIMHEHIPGLLRKSVATCLYHAADFLCCHDETHGFIANHLAGAVLSLLISASFFNERRFEHRAEVLLQNILARQSTEGWFQEYAGADPGYQTLCLSYLAHVYYLRQEQRLRLALGKAIDFLAWFVHPDGTFGGEYGSRRTAIFYPGGLAWLSRDFPMAQSITHAMLQAIAKGRTVTLQDVDMGNLAPLLTNYIMALDIRPPAGAQPAPPLPWQRDACCQDFPQAGLYARGTARYYAILGGSNGGVLKVFDRQQQALLWNDGGYVGQTARGTFITTQMTQTDHNCRVERDALTVQAWFYHLRRSLPSPAQFVLLRLLNLTVMRNIHLGNWIKTALVRLLISGKRRIPLHLQRTVTFAADKVVITDTLRCTGRVSLRWLVYGGPFVAIHMASSRYFEGAAAALSQSPVQIDVPTLIRQGEVRQQVTI